MSHQIASRGSPLKRVKVVEFEGIGPGPLAGLLLTQLGAEVTMVARPSPGDLPKDLTPREDGLLSRGKRRVVLNLKQEDDRTRALGIVLATHPCCLPLCWVMRRVRWVSRWAWCRGCSRPGRVGRAAWWMAP